MAEPTRMSGQGEAVNATSPAAASTPILEITSLREHSNVLAMLRSWLRKRHSSARQPRFAASASEPKANISPEDGGTPLPTLIAASTAMPRPSKSMNSPFASAAPAFHRSLRESA